MSSSSFIFGTETLICSRADFVFCCYCCFCCMRAPAMCVEMEKKKERMGEERERRSCAQRRENVVSQCVEYEKAGSKIAIGYQAALDVATLTKQMIAKHNT